MHIGKELLLAVKDRGESFGPHFCVPLQGNASMIERYCHLDEPAIVDEGMNWLDGLPDRHGAGATESLLTRGLDLARAS